MTILARSRLAPLEGERLAEFHQAKVQFQRRKNAAARCEPYEHRHWDRGLLIQNFLKGDM